MLYHLQQKMCLWLHGGKVPLSNTTRINTARSALSSILVLEDRVKFTEHPLVARCKKGIFELKPPLPKCTEIWDFNIVLSYLRAAAPLRSLSLKGATSQLNGFEKFCLTFQFCCL